ncbi:TAXI family TRAP transporter solute-binding subunit [Rhodovulum sulfidophilum]|uniref:TAXI family TRAP transporter solute-binding subunit n=1 Tax=Rhodovulum sulfidophilum TaxID=35806 RepID=UPI001920D630|nr:TAXI family TRAP transporter solute-binding subunit [Rhodovulum sulfidophilum]MBL3597774.1 TAXI family TRAP transporter solute-binding subunit [Rhodovulum sulfidophilum]
MRHIRTFATATTLAVLPLAAFAAPVDLRLITMEPGGSWYSYGSTFSEIIQGSEGENELNVEVLPRGGGMTNPVAVSQGAADLGFVSASAAIWARDGIGEEFEGREANNARAIVGGLQLAYTTIAVRRDYVEKSGLTTFDEMVASDNPPRFVLKPAGSQVPILANYMFEALGSSLEDMRGRGAITQISTAQIAQMLRDGTADVYIENAPVGQATMSEVTLTTPMVFVPASDTVLDHMSELGAPAANMPEGSYPGQEGAYRTSMTPTILIANADMDEEIAYQLTRALVEQREKIAEAFPALAGWDPEKGAQPDQAVIELHPGAARYYRERGWIE